MDSNERESTIRLLIDHDRVDAAILTNGKFQTKYRFATMLESRLYKCTAVLTMGDEYYDILPVTAGPGVRFGGPGSMSSTTYPDGTKEVTMDGVTTITHPDGTKEVK